MILAQHGRAHWATRSRASVAASRDRPDPGRAVPHGLARRPARRAAGAHVGGGVLPDGRTPVTVRQYAAFLAAGRRRRAAALVGRSRLHATPISRSSASSGSTPWPSPRGSAQRAATVAPAHRGRVGAGRARRDGRRRHAPGARRCRANEVPDGPLRGPWRVGQGTPNPYGLCDVGTIVHEWCLDVYRPYGAPAERPRTKANRVLRRSSRGGSWRHLQRWSSALGPQQPPPGVSLRRLRFSARRGALAALESSQRWPPDHRPCPTLMDMTVSPSQCRRRKWTVTVMSTDTGTPFRSVGW